MHQCLEDILNDIMYELLYLPLYAVYSLNETMYGLVMVLHDISMFQSFLVCWDLLFPQQSGRFAGVVFVAIAPWGTSISITGGRLKQRPFGLARYGMLRGKTGKAFLVQFARPNGAI